MDGIVFEPVEDTLPKVKLCFRQDWIPQSSSATSKYYVKEKYERGVNCQCGKSNGAAQIRHK